MKIWDSVYIYKGSLKNIHSILRICEASLIFRNSIIEQVQYSNWNITYAYEQLGKDRTNNLIYSNGLKGYSKIGKQIRKCGKACAKHICEISLDSQGRSMSHFNTACMCMCVC